MAWPQGGGPLVCPPGLMPGEGVSPRGVWGPTDPGADPVPVGLGALRGRACLTTATNQHVWSGQIGKKEKGKRGKAVLTIKTAGQTHFLIFMESSSMKTYIRASISDWAKGETV